ncbi:MAG TPA: tyrosine-type recombinase/integrase [Dermatophilaceae bacterium]|nr:tyrosine-type recombinase/integrase [Dermatophilaceae bacterium]
MGASRLRPPSTTRQGPNDRRARALSSREECVTPPPPVPVLRVLEACRGERTEGPLVLRPLSGQPIDRRDWYRIAKAAGIPRHISPHSLRHAITNALDAGVPLRDAQILARHADPRTTEHYDRARGNLERHGVHFLTAYVAGV